MSGITDRIESTSNTGSSTLAHELVAREEQNVGIFFAAFSIQFYLTKEMLKHKLTKPTFLMYFDDVEIYASQRVFIKNIISSHNYKKLCEDIEFVLNEHNNDHQKQPHEVYLSRINKAFLIRQIFKQTDQVLPKYNFIENYIGKSVAELDIEELYKKMELLPVEQQVLILVRIFNQLKDNFENKKKTILSSFIENITRIKQEYVSKGKTGTAEYHNIEMFANNYKH